MPRATNASSSPSQVTRLALPARARAMPAEVPRTMAKMGSAATRIVTKTRKPISTLQSCSLSGREGTPLGEPLDLESGCVLRKAIPTASTLFRPNYGSSSTRPKVATALLQTVDSFRTSVRALCEIGELTPGASINLLKARSDRKLVRPPTRGRRWTSFVADDAFPGRRARGLHEEMNPTHRLRVEHDAHTRLIHLSGEDGSSWTTIAVDRATRSCAVVHGRTQLDTARRAYESLYRAVTPSVRKRSTAARTGSVTSGAGNSAGRRYKAHAQIPAAPEGPV